MRMEKMYMPTLKEEPKDAEIPSHRLMLRAGMIRRSASGIYSYLPLCYRVVRKIEDIVREEMDRFGGQEILMSALQPKEIWVESGRWDTFGPEMFKLRDRNDREFCLGPTAEEYFTQLITNEITSYKQLPLNIYQIQTKYRDEKRPRFGINRAREFLMKDAYTFDMDQEAMEASYENMWKCYEQVFDRLGLDYKIVEGDSGAMGGNASHEFVALASTGEGAIYYSDDYAATDEKAQVHLEIHEEGVEEREVEKVHTPNCKTIAEVSSFLDYDEMHCVKAVDLMVKDQEVLVFIPGDRELNMAKLVAYLSVPEHEIRMMEAHEIRAIGSFEGYTGPVGLENENIRVIIDESVTKMKNIVVGANEEEYHLINVNYKRDFDGEIAEDLLLVQEGDICPVTGEAFKTARGIEVGNIFQLGKKYSTSLGAGFLDQQGKEKEFWMGSYGIGITRSVTAIIEQNHDDNGIIWPMIVAPYHVIITVISTKDEGQMALGEKIYEELQEKKVEVLLDDRKERPGVKFNDRDLIGIPLRITVGRGAKDEVVEYSTRKEMENEEINVHDAIERVLEATKNYR
ncbi:MAG: proline--tRNA ligase [Tissierellia bacterium]|nr:proline--tRNA ligase [Tissierellia bacterium]